MIRLSTFKTVILLSCALWCSQVYAQGLEKLGGAVPEILSPDVAFVPSIDEISDQQITINVDIQPGYYLYKEKIKLQSSTEGLEILSTTLPDGILVEDEFFGKTETYRQQAVVVATYKKDSALDQAELLFASQGCADIGICYPPQSQVLTLELPAQETNKTASVRNLLDGASTNADFNNSSDISGGQSSAVNTSPLKNDLSQLLANPGEPELIPPEIAFVPTITRADGNIIEVNFFIEDNYYLYKDKIAFSINGADRAKVVTTELPEGKLKKDEFFGLVPVFRQQAVARIQVDSDSVYADADLVVNYQGCADIGVCFPPQTTTLPVQLVANVESVPQTETRPMAGTTVAQSTEQINSPSINLVQSSDATGLSEQDRLARSLSGDNLWLIGLTFFGLGLLLAFTPCVFPMIPILSSIIVGQGKELSTPKAFSMSLVYVLAMAVTYTLAGVAVGLSGENIQIWFQTPWVLTAFAVLFVLLALSMFGFYELQMPASIQNRLNRLSSSQKGGNYLGVAIMGVLSALVVGPCVTAPLVGALIFIADTGNAFVGGLALFCLSLGMGAPLLLIGASFGKILPRSGAWMEATKAVFGVLMLAMAIWMLSRFIPAPMTLALAAALTIVSGIFLGATDSLAEGASGWRKLFKGLGILLLVYGIALLAGSMSGSHDVLQPLKGLTATKTIDGGSSTDHELVFETVKSVEDLDNVVAQASTQGRPVMLDFYADWCISCKEMEAFTFTDSGVIQRLSNAVLIQADVTANDATDKALLKRFGLFGPPGIIFYNTQGEELRNARVVGFMAADDFNSHLDKHL